MRWIVLILALACAGARRMAKREEEKWYFPDHEFDRTPLGDAVDTASMKMLQVAFTDAEDKNVVASPLGVLILLSLYSTGAAGENREEIVKALGATTYDELVKSYTSLSERFSSMDSTYLTMANKIYISSQYHLADSFSDTAVKSYHSEVEGIDFTNPQNAAEIINRWADQKTKGSIKDPVSEDTLSPDVAAFLVNIIYFQGHWNVPFDANNTVEKDFHVDKSTVIKKPMMQLTQSLFYHESPELGARLLELPYKEKNFRMVIVLPNEIDGLASVIEKASQRGLLSDVFALSPAGREVHIELPKFEIKSGLDLNNILPKMGVSRMFRDGADGIVRERPVVVSKAFQEAFVKVDEEGATAGAFTGMVAVPMSSLYVPPPPIEFKADHPFLFLILQEDTTMFVGSYTH